MNVMLTVIFRVNVMLTVIFRVNVMLTYIPCECNVNLYSV